jgi:hypothetical protein
MLEVRGTSARPIMTDETATIDAARIRRLTAFAATPRRWPISAATSTCVGSSMSFTET